MTSKITTLVTVRDAPNEEVITELREWLELARRGEVRGIALTARIKDGEGNMWRNSYTGEWKASDVAGALEQHAFGVRMDLYDTTNDADDVELPDDECGCENPETVFTGSPQEVQEPELVVCGECSWCVENGEGGKT